MILSTFVKDSKYTKLKITSTNNTKSATATSYKTYWRLKYSGGQSKNFSSFHKILEHLEKAGW